MIKQVLLLIYDYQEKNSEKRIRKMAKIFKKSANEMLDTECRTFRSF